MCLRIALCSVKSLAQITQEYGFSPTNKQTDSSDCSQTDGRMEGRMDKRYDKQTLVYYTRERQTNRQEWLVYYTTAKGKSGYTTIPQQWTDRQTRVITVLYPAMDWQMDRQRDGWMDRQARVIILIYYSNEQTDRQSDYFTIPEQWIDRQDWLHYYTTAMDRETDKNDHSTIPEKWTDRQTRVIILLYKSNGQPDRPLD